MSYFQIKLKVSCGLILIFFSFISSAQNYTTFKTASKKIQGTYQDAMNAIGAQNYTKATSSLEEATYSDPKFIDGWLLLGELYNNQGEYSKGKTALEKVVELGPEYNSKAYFFLAESSWNTDQYEDCMSACEKFLSFKDISVNRKNLTEQMLKNSHFAAEAIKHPVPFDPKSLGNTVNSNYPEYLPSITGDEQTIVFTRRLGEGKYEQEDFYSSYKKDDQWTTAVGLDNDINTDFNEGAQCMTPDGNTIYYVACNRPGGIGNCDIYFTQRNGNNWTTPKNLGVPVNNTTWETQPTISGDGRTMFFVSERAGTKGGGDIWVSQKDEKGKWSVPINAGDSINTSFEEMSPFIHPDGQTLYFASDGWQGMGKFDIFYSRKKADGTWGTPLNIGYPINSKNDDNSFVVSLNGQRAYFSSDRFKGNGDLDLYEIVLYADARPQPVTFVNGTVTDANSGMPVSADVQLLDLETGNLIAASQSDPVNGYYLVSIPSGKNYALNASAKGYLFYSENFSLKDRNPEKSYLMNVNLEPVSVGGSVVLKNIFFETDSYVLKDESKIELNKLIDLLNQNPVMKIQISGHTDDQGSEEHNITLSTNRAKTVYDFLISNDITANRISYKGFGESKPIVPNDSEEGRAQNRRTEFTVTGN